MRSVRILAIITFAMLVAYYILRALAVQCSGPECETYIPFSLLLPLAALVLAAITGYLAIGASRARRQAGWLALLIICTILSITGPIASAFIFRDSPDLFVPVATILILFAPLAALIYSFTGNAHA
jgi:heme/copper-type cytochrome/quinol oxidase subunit 3